MNSQMASDLTNTIDHERFWLGQQRLLSIILFACGFLAVQRLTISPINAYVCVLPMFMFAAQMLREKHESALSCLIVALFLSIDNGGGAYAETIALVRYVIYVAALTMLFYPGTWRIQRKPLLLAILLCAGITFGSIAGLGGPSIDMATLQRDLTVIFILTSFLVVSRKVKLNAHLVFSGSFGYLIGEVVNALLFYKDFNDYLSYDSLKAVVVFPLVYAFMTRTNVVSRITLAIFSLYVISLYGTRMIVLSASAILILILVMNLIRNRRRQSLLTCFVFLIAIANLEYIEVLADTDLMNFKALGFLLQIQQNVSDSDLYQIFSLLDPVRFAEHQLFFERPTYQVVFGNGLGSGLHDVNGELNFVTYDQTAFSVEEINSSNYYNLHDFWIDFGLRFGLFPIVYVVYKVVLQQISNNRPWHGFLFFMLLINTTFATSGILLTALLIRFMPHSSGK